MSTRALASPLVAPSHRASSRTRDQVTMDQDGMRKNFDICLEWAGLRQVRSVDMMMMMIPAESRRWHPLFKVLYIYESLIAHQAHYIVTILIPLLQLRNFTLLNVCVYRNFRNINIKNAS